MLHSLITLRYGNCWPSFDCMHEWENVFSRCLHLPLVPYNLQNIIDRSGFNDLQDIAIVALAEHIIAYADNRNIVPIVIDCWKQDIPTFIDLYRDYKLVYLVSLEACRDLAAAGFPGTVRYLPMSVADQIRPSGMPDKSIDVIQYGRINPVLDSFMRQFVAKYPHVEYVTRKGEASECRYASSTRGMLGEFRSRQQFLSLLSSAKVSLVSSPGMDGVADTGGYNPVSARFFESAAFYCHMLGRCPANEDFATCRVGLVCDHCDTYEEFEQRLSAMLWRPFDKQNAYETFLNLHLTSRRAYEIQRDIKQLFAT